MFHDTKAMAILLVAAAIAGAVTWIFAITLGRRIARSRPVAARMIAALFFPLALLAFGIARFMVDQSAHPGSDWPAMAMAGTIMVAGMSPAVTLPIAFASLRRRSTDRRYGTATFAAATVVPPSEAVTMTRDSICMADDVDAPHEQAFAIDGGCDLLSLARMIAGTSYLPMPSDAWGWTIEWGEVVVAIRPSGERRMAVALRGDPSTVSIDAPARLSARYVRRSGGSQL